MSTQGGSNTTNSSSISGWFFGNQDKNTGNGFSSGISNVGGGGGSKASSGNVGGGGGSNESSGNSGNGFMSISKNTKDGSVEDQASHTQGRIENRGGG